MESLIKKYFLRSIFMNVFEKQKGKMFIVFW